MTLIKALQEIDIADGDPDDGCRILNFRATQRVFRAAQLSFDQALQCRRSGGEQPRSPLTTVVAWHLGSSIASRRYCRTVRNRGGIAHWCTSLGARKAAGHDPSRDAGTFPANRQM